MLGLPPSVVYINNPHIQLMGLYVLVLVLLFLYVLGSEGWLEFPPRVAQDLGLLLFFSDVVALTLGLGALFLLVLSVSGCIFIYIPVALMIRYFLLRWVQMGLPEWYRWGPQQYPGINCWRIP